MQICQYEFQFEDEFMNRIRDEISKLLNIPIDNVIRKNIAGEMFILRKDTENKYILFASHKTSCMCLVIIRCNVTYEKEIQKLLFDICHKMEDCYDEDHRKEVINVFGNTKTHLKNLEELYKISSLFGICVD